MKNMTLKSNTLLTILAIMLAVTPILSLNNVFSQTVWTKYDSNGDGIPDPVILRDADVSMSTIIYRDSQYQMWIPLDDGVYLTTSQYGYEWTDPEKVLSPDNDGDGISDAPWHALSTNIPSVIYNEEESIYQMWYRGYPGHGGPQRYGYATSDDGIQWNKYDGDGIPDPVIEPGKDGPGDGTWDDYQIGGVTVILDGSSYKMWYHANSYADKQGGDIGYATSVDGIHWTKYDADDDGTHDPVIIRETTLDWDASKNLYIGGSAVIKEESIYKLWYSGRGVSGLTHIGYTTSSDGADWEDTVTVLSPHPDGYERLSVFNPSVLRVDSEYWMWYVRGHDETGRQVIGLAFSDAPCSPPIIDSISTPIEPVRVESPLEVSALFSGSDLASSYTAEWNWGDDTTSIGTISGAGEVKSITASHTYDLSGVYTVTLTVTHDACGSDTLPAEDYIVVYDPDGGFVTGGGWITSPVGAYSVDPTLTGKANFGFVSKYKKGASVPTGQTEFQFKVADLNFQSDSYEWLVIAGQKAMYKGEGMINGEGEYKFVLSAIDGDLQGGDGVDTFRMKIWTEDENGVETVVYDNQLGDADASTALGGGNIKIHKG